MIPGGCGRKMTHLLHHRLVAPLYQPFPRPKKILQLPESILVPTLAELLSAICTIFKVNRKATKEKAIMTIWVQHLHTGLGIFAQLLIWKNQTYETDSLCFFILFSSVFLECSPANHLAGSPTALIRPHTQTSSWNFFVCFWESNQPRLRAQLQAHCRRAVPLEWHCNCTMLAVRPSVCLFDWDCQQSDKYPHQKHLKKNPIKIKWWSLDLKMNS